MSAKKVQNEYLRIHKIFVKKQNKLHTAKGEYDTIRHELDAYLATWQPVVSAYRDAPKTPPGWFARLFGAK